MTTLEKIKNLTDNEAITLYQGFSRKLLKETRVNALDVIKNPPLELSEDETTRSIQNIDLEKLDSIVKPDEVIPVVRIILEKWGENPEMEPVLNEFMQIPQENVMAAGTILAIGSVLVATIISSSIEITYKDDKRRIIYKPENCKYTVELVKAVLSGIPKTLKEIIVSK